MPADPGAGRRDEHRGPGPDPGRVHRRAGLLGRRGLQPDLLADPPHAHHQGRGPRAPGLGPPCRRAPGGHRGAGRGNRTVGVDGPHRLRLDRQAARRVPPGRGRDPDRRREGRGPQGGPGRAGRGDLRPVPPRRRGGRGAVLRGPAAAGGDHLPGCGRHLRGPHPGVRRGGDRGAGGPVRPGGRAGHPDQGPALSRRAAGRDAAPGRGRPAAGAGRAAGAGVGARDAGRAAGPR